MARSSISCWSYHSGDWCYHSNCSHRRSGGWSRHCDDQCWWSSHWRCCSGDIRWWPGARATVPTVNADKLVTSDTVRQSLAIWLLEPPSRLPIPMSTQRTTSTSDSSSWGTDFGGLFEKFYTSHHTPKNVLGLKIFYFKNKRRRSSIIFWWIVSQSAKVCLWSPSSCSKPQMIGCTPISTPMVAKPHKSHTCGRAFLRSTTLPNIWHSPKILLVAYNIWHSRNILLVAYNIWQFLVQTFLSPWILFINLCTIHMFITFGWLNGFFIISKEPLIVGCLLAHSTLELYAFSYVDWGGCPVIRHSTTSF